MSKTISGLGATRAGLEDELSELLLKRKHLEIALSEFRHQGRRVNDRLERLGGSGRELEAQRSLLSENEQLTKRELAETEAQIQKIRRELS